MVNVDPPSVQPSPALRVRRMGLQDLPFIVGAHLEHFPEGFFARLGERFLTRYYRTFLDGPLATALVAEVDGDVSGYLAGVLDGPEHRRLLLRYHGPSLLLAGVAGMLRRPSTGVSFIATRMRRYLTALNRHRKTRSLPRQSSPQRPAVLSHVVVTKSLRCRGIGTVLVDRFLLEAREASCTQARLVTVAGARGAGSFYQRRGWRREPGFAEADGRLLERYRYDLEAPHSPATPTATPTPTPTPTATANERNS